MPNSFSLDAAPFELTLLSAPIPWNGPNTEEVVPAGIPSTRLLKPLAETTCEEYALSHSLASEWHSSRPEEVVYLSARNRLRIKRESHEAPGFGLSRADAIDESRQSAADPSSIQKDVQELAESLSQALLPHLSRKSLAALIASLTKASEDWRAQDSSQFMLKRDKL